MTHLICAIYTHHIIIRLCCIGVPALELKAMEQYCINMAHTLRYLFDKMRKISAHPQHAKDLTPAGWKRFCVRVLAVAYFRLPLLQQPV